MSHHQENNLAEKDLKRDLENEPGLNNTPSIAGAQVHDDVFGDITDEGPNYRAVSYISHAIN